MDVTVPDRLRVPWQELIESEWSGLELARLEQPAALSTDEIEAFRSLSNDSLHFFTVFVLGRVRLGAVGSFHWTVCERLEHLDNPQLHLYYRKAFKTTIAGVAYPLWRAAQDPEYYSHLKMVSDRELGEQQLLSIRWHVEHNEVLRTLYSWMRPHPKDWSAEKASLACRDFRGAGSTFEFRTLWQGSAGRHVTDIGMDDLVNEANCENRTEQERMFDRLKMVWPILDTDALVITGTRYRDYDTYGLVIRHWYPEDLDVFVQPVRGRGWINPDDGRTVLEDDGVYAHPEEWDDEVVAKEQRRMVDPYLFSCQYMLDTSHRGGRGFDEAWLQYVADDDLPPLSIYLAVDPASGKGPSDPALAVVGIDERGNYYPLWACGEYDSEAQFLDALFATARLWRPVRVGQESYGQGGKSMQQQIAARSRETNYWLPLEIMTHGLSDKEVHIRQSMRPQYETGHVYHPERLRGSEYERQLLTFPGGVMNDLIDAMAYAFKLCLTFGYVGPRTDGPEPAVVITYPDVPRGYTLEEMTATERAIWADVEEAEQVGSIW